MKLSCSHSKLFAIALIAGIAVVVLCSVVQADRIMIGLDSGEVYGRDEYDLATSIASSYINFGSATPVSALAGADGIVAIGLNSTGNNVSSRSVLDLAAEISTIATGSAISSMGMQGTGTVLIGERGVGSAWSGTFVRSITDMTQIGAGYLGGSVPAPGDGWNWGTGISGLTTFTNGDFLVGCDSGVVTTRRSTDIFNYVTDLAVAGHGSANFGTPITAVAALPNDKFAVGLSTGYIDIRPRNDTWILSTSVNFGVPITALAALPDGKIAIGLGNGQVHVRSTTNLTTASTTSATFTSGAAIKRLALTSNGNLAIGTADNLVFVRMCTDLASRPAGYVGVDGVNFGSPVNALVSSPVGTSPPSPNWRAISNRSILQNDALEARFQSGVLYQLTDRVTGRTLVSIDPTQLPGTQRLFGSSTYNLDGTTVSLVTTSTTVSSTFTGSGVTWQLSWSIEPGMGDLVFQTSATTSSAVDEFRAIFFGCNISDSGFVWVDGYGCGQKEHAPWTGVKLGDPQTGGSPMSFIQPLIVLFEGNNSGWFMEGREQNIGPACVMVAGRGQTVDVGMVRRFPATTQSPQMYEVRMRTYSSQWENAVDPYTNWMQNTVGFVPIEQKSPEWVRGIKNQAYVTVGNYAGLDELATKVDPQKTFVGRQAEYRNYAFDIGYPNYQVAGQARAWFTYARQKGFHVGAHFNAFCIDKTLYPNLVTQFQAGLQQVGTDGSGNPIYDGFGDRMVYCSPAYKPWRDYLIAQMADAVNSGVDVIYLDQTMGPGGKFLVNGVTGVQGVIHLEREIMEKYPGVTVETEQFNPMASRHAGFALSQMPNGHPLSGYIFSKFIKIVPEGIMYSPLDTQTMDAFDTWGFMVPGTDVSREGSWMEIVQAVQAYDLKPDSRLPRREPDNYIPHYTSGTVPLMDFAIPPEGVKLFGFQGTNGVTAYFEKHPTERGLVIYEPGQSPRWVGKRHYGISTWSGPGGIKDWLLYNGNTLIGLEPAQTYYFDPSVTMPAGRFHVTSIPADFALYSNSARRIYAQEAGSSDSYFRVEFTGHGQMDLYVPDDYDVYLNSQMVFVNRQTNSATITVSADLSNRAVIRAFRRSERDVIGKWSQMPWERPVVFSYGMNPDTSDGFYNEVAGRGMIFGRLSQIGNIRVRGSYGMSPNSTTDFIDGHGVIKINGTEVLRIPPGSPPYQMVPFDVDITAFAGQYVMFEFMCDGAPHGYAYAQWASPHIVADSSVAGMLPIGASSQNGWNSTSAVTVRSSSQHPTYVSQNTINGSAISADGMLHGNTGLFVTDQLSISKANPRGGTVPGGHWIEFTFDKVYPLGEVWIWNENAKSGGSDWRVQGFKTVTIQHSLTGSSNPADWATAFTGDIPMAYSLPPDYLSLPAMKLGLAGVNAKHVVITTADTPNQNWSGGLVSDAGLGEVRFYSMSGQASIRGSKLGTDGDNVSLDGAVVTAAFRDNTGPISFAVEELARTTGIRVISAEPVLAGDNVTVSGQIDTVNGERVIAASQVIVNSHDNAGPLPLGMTNIGSGGGAYYGQGGVVNNADTALMSGGVNSIGLLITTFGRVTARNDTGDWSGYFYIDDGSGLKDGSGNMGIKCRPVGAGSTPDALPSPGSYVIVTGVLGVERVGGVNTRYLWTSSVRGL